MKKKFEPVGKTMDQVEQIESFADEMLSSIGNAMNEAGARLQEKYQFDQDSYNFAMSRAWTKIGELMELTETKLLVSRTP